MMQTSSSTSCTSVGVRLIIISVLTFIIMRVFYLSYVQNESLSDEVEDRKIVHKPLLPLPTHQKSFTTQQLVTTNITKPVSEYNNTVVTRNKTKKKSYRPQGQPYESYENVVSKVEIRWADFVSLPMQTPRNKIHFKPSLLSGLIQCSGSSQNRTCNDNWSDSLITTWKSRKVKDLCEDNANSKIACYDSPTGSGKSRYCIFDNAMMNFKKVRRRKQDGAVTRSWERGFLSTECGEFAKDDIGYLPLYKPDIEGQDDAICDYVFNETVIVYSHENIRNFGQMTNDYLNVFAMLWLSGISQETKDVSLFNIDAVRKGKYFGDQPNQFFKHYDMTFRRILKAADFTESNSKLCFKRIILQPRPVLQFLSESTATPRVTSNISSSSSSSSNTGDSGSNDTKCLPNYIPRSSLFQRYNLQMRYNYGLLTERTTTNEKIKLLLITRSINAMAQSLGAISNSINIVINNVTTEVLPPATSTRVTSRLFLNEMEMVTGLRDFISTYRNTHTDSPVMELVTQDLAVLSFEEQMQLIGSSSVVIGMHGAGIASAGMHMAIGTKYCCGVIEIFPQQELRGVKGYGVVAKRMGLQYERLDLSGNATTSRGSAVPVQFLTNTVENMLTAVQKKSSCFVPSVLSSPYL